MTAKILAIGGYTPGTTIRAADRAETLGFDTATLASKIGTDTLPVMADDTDTSDLAVGALQNLFDTSDLSLADVDGVILCTQNPDGAGLPHTSAIVHGKLGLPTQCMCFDISLGCSGYVHGLAVARGLMDSYGLKNVVLVTADPYSKVVDITDAHTSLIFGDGATATWIAVTQDAGWIIGAMKYLTNGAGGQHLMVQPNGKLHMNGREVFFFAAKVVPDQVNGLLQDQNITADDVDLFLFHQGSKYILETITKKLRLTAAKVPSNIDQVGNLVSSSIPMLLKAHLEVSGPEKIVLSGFGVGLSAASMILDRA